MKKIGAGHVKTAYSDDLSNYLLMNAKNRKAVRYLGTACARLMFTVSRNQGFGKRVQYGARG